LQLSLIKTDLMFEIDKLPKETCWKVISSVGHSIKMSAATLDPQQVDKDGNDY